MKRLLLGLGIAAFLAALLVVVGGVLGLRVLADSANMPDDGPRIATSPQAAASLVQKVSSAGERAVDTGRLNLTVTEREATSFLNLAGLLKGQVSALQGLEGVDLDQLKGTPEGAQLADWLELMQNSDALAGRDLSDLQLRLGIKEPEVRFKADGQVVVRGYVAILFWRVPVRIAVAPRASDGEIVLDFVEGRLGRVRMPEVVFDLLGKGIARAIMLSQDLQDRAEITRIQVEAGKLTFGGRYRK